MKTTLRLLCLVFAFAANSAFSQTLDKYFKTQGVYSLAQAEHPSNDYVGGSYDIHDGYVDVFINGQDNTFDVPVETNVRLLRGEGGLLFTDIITLKDTDFIDPFEAFGFEANLMTALYKNIDKEAYNQMRAAVQKNFGTDFEHWTGKMWAILALNLDYYEFLLGQ